MVGDLGDDALEAADDGFLALAEGGLVGNLIEIAERLGAFAVETADGEADLVDRLEDLADLVAEHEAGQVEHGGGAQAGAEIGRAGGEVAERGIEGEFERVFQLGVEFRERVEGGGELEARADGLHAEVILLVEHEAEGLAAFDHGGGAVATGGVFAGDEVALDQHLFLHRAEVAEFLGKRVLHRRQGFDGRAHQFERGGALFAFRPTGKRMAAEVAGQADARGQHGTMLRLPAGHPIGGVFDEGGEAHHGADCRTGSGRSASAGVWSGTWSSPRLRISSRMPAASS